MQVAAFRTGSTAARRTCRIAAGAWLAAAALVLSAATAGAEGTRSPEDRGVEGWELYGDLYGWLPVMDLTADINDQQVSGTITISDELENLDGALMGGFEARWKRLIFSTDVTWAKIGVRENFGPVPATVGPLSFMQGPILVNVPAVTAAVGPLQLNTSTNLVIVDSWLGYRLLALPIADDGRDVRLDLTSGFRYWNVTIKSDVTLPPIGIPGFTVQPSIPALPGLTLPGIQVGSVNVGGFDIRTTDNPTWADWTIGGRVGVDVLTNLRASVGADIGGFGIGNSSHLTWYAEGLLQWNVWKRLDLILGMKSVAVYRDGFEGVLWGPKLGLGWQFH